MRFASHDAGGRLRAGPGSRSVRGTARPAPPRRAIAARFLSLAPPAASGWAERGLCVRGGQGAPHPGRWVWGEPSTQRREATTLGSPTVRARPHPEHSRRGTVAAPKTELPLTDRLATRSPILTQDGAHPQCEGRGAG
ncbi:MAG: hypothetical protein HYY59_00370 [Candidatus Omnitrophica bacterium]|nr:hypothetical protein [Candidatus Omnitrophota bacterium]